MVPGTSSAVKIFKWVDANGKVHFSDSPPPGANVQEIKLRVPSYEGEADVKPLAAATRRVTIYVTETCGYCRRAKAHLNRRGVAFTEFDVEKDPIGRRQYQQLRGRGVPIILVGDQRMDGYSEPRLEALLKQAGF